MRSNLRTTRISRSSLPLLLAERNWKPLVLAAVCTSTGVATWSFVIGGSAAIYVGAVAGMIAMTAGALLGQMLVNLATVPVATKHGIETTTSTKPQLGSRGSVIGLGLLLFTSIGWNTVLMIFFGRAAASAMIVLGVAGEGSRDLVATLFSAGGLVVLAFLVTRGARSLSRTGPTIAVCIVILTGWLLYLLLDQFGWPAIATAEPLDPADSFGVNYTSVFELLVAGTFGWWGYMGGMVRMVSKAGKTILPTMVGLGLAWAVVASVSLFGALMTGEPDPTIWAPMIAGDFTAVIVLIFIALANLGSTLVGIFVSTLAIKQTRGLGRKVSWNTIVVCVATPMLLCIVLIPHLIFDNVPVFMAYLGMMLGPMIGVQIADWYILGRRKTLSVAALYQPGKESAYWYFGGFNPAGILGLILGTLTYAAILNPNTYVPNAAFFQYTTAAIPSVVVGGLVYVIGTRIMARFLPAAPHQQGTAVPQTEETT